MIPIKGQRRNPNKVRAKKRRAKETKKRDMTSATTKSFEVSKRQRAIEQKERVAARKAAQGK